MADFLALRPRNWARTSPKLTILFQERISMDGTLAEILGRLESIRGKIKELRLEHRRLAASFHEAVAQLAQAASELTEAKAHDCKCIE